MHRRAETFSGPVGGSDVNEILKVADLSMNTRTRDVMRGDRAIRLSVKEYDLLNLRIIFHDCNTKSLGGLLH